MIAELMSCPPKECIEELQISEERLSDGMEVCQLNHLCLDKLLAWLVGA